MIDYQPTIAIRSSAHVQPAGLGVVAVIFLIFLCLVVGHLTLKTYFSSVAINAVGLGLVSSILYWVLYLKKDVFSFLLIIFICSQFKYADNQGGLFNLVAFILLLPYVLTRNIRETRQANGMLLNVLLTVLVLANMLGLLLRNPLPNLLIVQQAAAFSSFLLAFYVASHLRWTVPRLKKLTALIGFFVAFNFLISMNHHYSIIRIDSPLLGLTESTLYATENAFGTFRSSSANAQYAMMIFAFIVPLLCSSTVRVQLALRPAIFVGICILCMSLTILANMRAAAGEIVIITVLYTLMFGVFYRRSFRYAKYLNRFTVVGAVFLLAFGFLIGVENIARDFEIAASAANTGDILTGEALNRGSAWRYGLDLLINRSWIIGFGHGVAESNLIATGAVRGAGGWIGGGHLHNLYLMLPLLYGWVGSIAFLGIFFVPMAKAFRIVRRLSFDNFYVVVNLSFLVSITFLLLDEIKAGNIVQSINYPMLIFIWLGWAVAAQRTLRFEAIRKSMSEDRASGDE